MEDTRVDAVNDQISKLLSEPNLQHFLCLLLAKYAAQMSTLSKIWYTSWNSLCNLILAIKLPIMKWITVGTFRKRKPKLVNIVDQILAHRQKAKGFYKKVLAKFSSYQFIISNVHNWIETLVVSTIKELILKVYGHVDDFNILLEEIFTAQGLICRFKHGLPLILA